MFIGDTKHLKISWLFVLT